LEFAHIPHYLQDRVVKVIGEEIALDDFNPLCPRLKRKHSTEEIKRKFPTANSIGNVVALESPYQDTPEGHRRGFRDEVEVITLDLQMERSVVTRSTWWTRNIIEV
jgi:hypothetical protein